MAVFNSIGKDKNVASALNAFEPARRRHRCRHAPQKNPLKSGDGRGGGATRRRQWGMACGHAVVITHYYFAIKSFLEVKHPSTWVVLAECSVRKYNI